MTRPLAVLLLLSVLATLIYSNTFPVPFLFDDKPNIIENPTIKDLRNFFDLSGTRYVGFLSFALNYHFGGLDVFGYHLVNLLIHITNGFLVYILVLMLFKAPGLQFVRAEHVEAQTRSPFDQLRVNGRWIALATALLFVAHPIQTQAVTYIVQRFASLVTLFYLLTVVCYLKWRLASSEVRNRHLWYAMALLSTVLAMKTKENSFTLPFMILLVEAVFFRPFTRKRWVALIPFLLTLPVIPLSHPGAIGEGEAGFAQETTEISRSDYLFTQFRVIVTYIRLLFLPIHQNLDYDYPISHSLLEPVVLLSFLFLLSLFVLALYLLFNSQLKTHHSQLISFGIIWFFLTLSIESSIIPIRDVIFEHRLYLPSVGFFMVLSVGGMMGRKWLQRQGRPPAWGVIRLGAVVLVLSAATYQRNMVWKDDLTLWQDVVNKAPNKARGHNGLGVAYKDKGMLGQALGEFQMALRLQPDHVEAHNNLGIVYAIQENWEAAHDHFQGALRLKPDYVRARINLGSIYTAKGRLEEAIREYQIALQLQPDVAEAHYNLGNVYVVQGHVEEAIRAYQMALRLKPEYPDAYNNLGVLYKSQGALKEAIRAYQMALRLKPGFVKALRNLGNVYAAQGRLEEAIQQYQTALRLQPDDAEAHNSLGHAYRQQGRISEAKEAFEQALQIKPDFPTARQALESLPKSAKP